MAVFWGNLINIVFPIQAHNSGDAVSAIQSTSIKKLSKLLSQNVQAHLNLFSFGAALRQSGFSEIVNVSVASLQYFSVTWEANSMKQQIHL